MDCACDTTARALATLSKVSASYFMYCLQVSTSLGSSSWRCLGSHRCSTTPGGRCFSPAPARCKRPPRRRTTPPPPATQHATSVVEPSPIQFCCRVRSPFRTYSVGGPGDLSRARSREKPAGRRRGFALSRPGRRTRARTAAGQSPATPTLIRRPGELCDKAARGSTRKARPPLATAPGRRTNKIPRTGPAAALQVNVTVPCRLPPADTTAGQSRQTVQQTSWISRRRVMADPPATSTPWEDTGRRSPQGPGQNRRKRRARDACPGTARRRPSTAGPSPPVRQDRRFSGGFPNRRCSRRPN